MTCAELRSRLDAYVQGTLSSQEAAALEDHLTSCADCAALLEQSEPLPDQVHSLRQSVEPAADLWPGIHARIAARRGAGRGITLPSWLLAAAAVLLIIERSSRRAVAEGGQARWRAVEPERLTGLPAAGAVFFCLALIGFGLFLPLGWLLAKGWGADHETARLIASGRNALFLAVLAAVVTTGLAALLAFGSRGFKLIARVVSLGYSTPGAVMAVGLLAPAGLVWRTWPSTVSSVGFAVCLLIFAYAARLMASALEPIESGLDRVGGSMRSAARSLGETEAVAARRVDLPIASGAMFTAALLVFIDVLKELPATIILRPFGFDTLAVMADYYARDERLGEAAWPSLIIVLIGLPAVIWLTRRVSASRPGASA